MIRMIALARRAQGIGSGLHPESHCENTSKLFICAPNKNSRRRVHTYREASGASLRSLRRLGMSCLRADINERSVRPGAVDGSKQIQPFTADLNIRFIDSPQA